MNKLILLSLIAMVSSVSAFADGGEGLPMTGPGVAKPIQVPPQTVTCDWSKLQYASYSPATGWVCLQDQPSFGGGGN